MVWDQLIRSHWPLFLDCSCAVGFFECNEGHWGWSTAPTIPSADTVTWVTGVVMTSPSDGRKVWAAGGQKQIWWNRTALWPPCLKITSRSQTCPTSKSRGNTEASSRSWCAFECELRCVSVRVWTHCSVPGTGRQGTPCWGVSQQQQVSPWSLPLRSHMAPLHTTEEGHTKAIFHRWIE